MTPSAPFSVCVYCGSRPGADERYAHAANEIGRLIAERGWRLVYGGGKAGLMGIVANAALAAHGTVLGVIPRLLQDREIGHDGLDELRVVNTMHERKQAMAEASDAFVALPGGIGTLEELFEVWTWRHIGFHRSPVGLLDTAGFYAPLLSFMRHTEAAGFIDARQQAMLHVDSDPARLLDTLHAQAQTGPGPSGSSSGPSGFKTL